LRAAGSPDPAADAPLVVATLTGLVLGRLTTPHPSFEEAILRPALERLFARLVDGDALAHDASSLRR
jgi:hypothetical protein